MYYALKKQTISYFVYPLRIFLSLNRKETCPESYDNKSLTRWFWFTTQIENILGNKRDLGHIWNMVPFSLRPCQPYLSDKSNQFYSKETFISSEMCYSAVKCKDVRYRVEKRFLQYKIKILLKTNRSSEI